MRSNRGVRATSRPVSIPAPVGGWNARDSLGDMPTTDAVSITNWFPATTEVVLRKGCSVYSSGITGQVETLFSYAGPSATKLFAVAGGSIYDCSAGGAVGAAAVSGLANSRFQYVNMETAGGNFLIAVNGSDKMRYFDGTTWSADGGTYTVTVADTSNWTNLTFHKQRLWAIQKSSLKAWYMPVGSIAGAASLFDLSAFFQLGGYLVAVANWTLDGGQGLDDYLVFISSRGEVLVYYGNDPLGAWSMKGLYRVGSPVGSRCLYKFAGDLLVICQDGLMPLSQALQSSRVDPRIAISNKIQYAVSTAVSSYGATFGWQVLNFPRENMLILNIPISSGQQQQFVMNTINGSWCNFTQWFANCWELYRDAPYFGSDGKVYKAWEGTDDAGFSIPADCLQSFNYFDRPGSLKRFSMCRPVLRASSVPAVQAQINVDFDVNLLPASLQYGAAAGSLWDAGIWDSSLWGTGLDIYKDWQGASGIGYAAAPRVTLAGQGIDVRWVSTDIVMEHGAIL
jgi:hypothetical protein